VDDRVITGLQNLAIVGDEEKNGLRDLSLEHYSEAESTSQEHVQVNRVTNTDNGNGREHSEGNQSRESSQCHRDHRDRVPVDKDVQRQERRRR